MPIARLHQQVAEIALRASAPHGFALGGGNALIAHGVISRPTQDVDLFTDDEAGVNCSIGRITAWKSGIAIRSPPAGYPAIISSRYVSRPPQATRSTYRQIYGPEPAGAAGNATPAIDDQQAAQVRALEIGFSG